MPSSFPIISPLVTEKATRDQEHKRYTFAVRKDANKTAIKKAIKELYGVEVAEVKTSIMPKKVRLVGRRREWTKRPIYKKAVISLKDNKTIDPNKPKDAKKK